MDFKIPGLPHSVVKHAQSTSVRELIQKIESHPNRHALQQDLRQNQSFSPFSPESKTNDVGRLETLNCVNCSRRNPKRSAKYVLSYLDIGIVYCTCGPFLREGRWENQKFIKFTMDLLSIPDYVSRKDDLTDIDTVRSRETGNITLSTSWRSSAKRGFSRASMTDLYEMNNSANEWLKMIETKEDACRQMDALADEDHTHHLTPKNITIIKVMVGFVRTRQVPILCQCSADLTSNKHCLPCSNWKKKKELKEINNGHKVLLLLHGGVGKVLGGLFIPMKVTMEMNQVLIEQGDLLYKYIGTILQGMIFLNSFTLLQMDRLQLTAVYCNRRRV